MVLQKGFSLFVKLSIISLYVNATFCFIHPLVRGHLGHFHAADTVNSAAVNTRVRAPL